MLSDKSFLAMQKEQAEFKVSGLTIATSAKILTTFQGKANMRWVATKLWTHERKECTRKTQLTLDFYYFLFQILCSFLSVFVILTIDLYLIFCVLNQNIHILIILQGNFASEKKIAWSLNVDCIYILYNTLSLFS